MLLFAKRLSFKFFKISFNAVLFFRTKCPKMNTFEFLKSL